MARKLSELTAIATLADADTFVMRDASADDAGGTATKAQVAAWLGGGSGYTRIGEVAAGAYSTGDADIAAASSGATWTRLGNGGTASAGDAVSVFGIVTIYKSTSGAASPGVTFVIPLPFVMNEAKPYAVSVFAPEFASLPNAYPDSGLNVVLPAFDGETELGVIWSFSYQTANAVDP